MINQMRIYDVPPHNREPFLDRFRDHAARLMADHEFRIQAMWTVQEKARCRFVYLLTWTDTSEMAHCWDSFMADDEWSRIKTETSAVHGDFVLGIEDLVLEPTDFSAAIGDTP